jgi:hypothetical protein
MLKRNRLPASGRVVEATVLSLGYIAIALVLFAHWSALAQHVVDVPYGDDWRQLRNGPYLLPEGFDLEWLFLSSNRTVYATGKLLDYVFFTYTEGSYAVYQQISSAFVLGGCALLSMLLLRRLRLPLPWHLLGVLSTVYLLQVPSYWGIATLAYHQTLPVLGVLAVALLVTDGRSGALHAVLLGLITLSSGLAYVSGAVAMFSVGVFLVAAAVWLGPSGQVRGLMGKAAVVLGVGALTLILQLVLVEKITLQPDQRALPFDWQFWHYGFHLVARAIGVAGSGPRAALHGAVLTALVFGLPVAAIVSSAWSARRAEVSAPESAYVIISGAVLVAVAGFLVVISYGRAHPHLGYSPLELAEAARGRFHYWWVTVLLPWAAIAPHFIRARRRHREAGLRRMPAWAAALVMACALVAQQSPGPWSFDAYYERHGKSREYAVKCLRRFYRRTRPVDCPEILGTALEGDLRPHIDNARARLFSFPRQLE